MGLSLIIRDFRSGRLTNKPQRSRKKSNKLINQIKMSQQHKFIGERGFGQTDLSSPDNKTRYKESFLRVDSYNNWDPNSEKHRNAKVITAGEENRGRNINSKNEGSRNGHAGTFDSIFYNEIYNMAVMSNFP